MTSNTDGAAQGEWHKYRMEPRADYKILDAYENMIAMFVREEDADQIIADHRKAQMVDVLAKALDNMLRWEADVEMEIPNDELLSFYLDHAKDWNLLLDIARAALAQFHAATEEATR